MLQIKERKQRTNSMDVMWLILGLMGCNNLIKLWNAISYSYGRHLLIDLNCSIISHTYKPHNQCVILQTYRHV